MPENKCTLSLSLSLSLLDSLKTVRLQQLIKEKCLYFRDVINFLFLRSSSSDRAFDESTDHMLRNELRATDWKDEAINDAHSTCQSLAAR